MKIINADVEFVTPIDGEAILKHIEQCARTCYKSESAITEDSAQRMVKNLIKNKHEAMLEHYSFTVRFTVDRGVSHELVRHRLASFAQESTRYCNYSQDKFGNEITVIRPCWFADSGQETRWIEGCENAERSYFEMLDYGCTPQEARSVLPNSLKTEVIMTANLREWRHFFKLRALGITGAPHPQMKEIACKLLDMCKEKIPIIFDDLIY